MPSLFLKQSESSFKVIDVSVTVKLEYYSLSNIFKRYKHTFSPPKEGLIFIFNDKKSDWRISGNDLFTITTGKRYSKAKITDAYVYYNRYDDKLENPLLFALLFDKIQKPNFYNKYYTRSDFETKLSGTQSVDISGLQNYENEKSIFEALLDENDKLTELVTYDIDLKLGDLTSGYRPYNVNKISVEDDSKTISTLSEKGFKRFKHTPFGAGSGKNACVTLNKNLLFQNNRQPLNNLQNRVYGYVNVYWSNKLDIPLLLEFNGDPRDLNKNEFYYYRSNSNGLYWSVIKQKSTVLSIELEDKINVFKQFIGDNNTKLFKLLENLQLSLLKTIVFLVDRYFHDYVESDVKAHLGNHDYRLRNKAGKIIVKDQTDTSGKCLKKSGFKVFEHDFAEIVKYISSGEDVKLKLVRYNVENTNLDNIVLNLDTKISTRYLNGSYEILVSDNYNLEYKYTWYRHSCDAKIFKGIFQLEFNGQVLTIDGDLNDNESNNNQVFIYFETDNKDRFIIIAFTSTNQDKIWYLTYTDFKQCVHNKYTKKISNLTPLDGSTKSQTDTDGRSQKLSLSIKQLLDSEKAKHCVLYLKLDNNNKISYSSGSIEINVSEQNNKPFNNYKTFVHHFISDVRFYDIYFYSRGSSKVLDIAGTFNGEDLNSVSFYYHVEYEIMPLIMSITTKTQVNKYFKYSEFILKSSNIVKLSDLIEVTYTQLQEQLEQQYKNLFTNITLDVFSTVNYSGFIVSSLNPYGNYKYYIHTPNRYHKYVRLNEYSMYKVENLQVFDHTYDNLIDVFVYYYGFDKENKCPLIIRFYSKRSTREDTFEYDYSYYCLSNIDKKNYSKTYKKIGLGSKSLTTVLNETYEKFKKEIKQNLNLVQSVSTETVYSSKGKSDKLYLFYYKSDPRALAFCYDNQAYKRDYVDEQNSKWIAVSNVRTCLCIQSDDNNELLDLLNELSKSLGLVRPNEPEQPESELSVSIDTSKTNDSYNDTNSITVSRLQEYSNCDLFSYCTHSMTNRTKFKISTIKISKPIPKTITIEEPLCNVLSVNVYFNINVAENPVLLEINISDGNKKYLMDLDKKTSCADSDLINIEDEEFVSKLIDESDRINNRVTYQIDKTGPYNKIKVISSLNSENGFTSYKHSPKDSNAKISNLLNNTKMLIGRTMNKLNHIEEIQNKVYNDVTVYWLDLNNYPILVNLKVYLNYNSCVLKKDRIGFFWTLESFSYQTSLVIRNKLDEIYYSLKSSVIIEMNKMVGSNTTETYQLKLIDNTPNSDKNTPVVTKYTDAKKMYPVEKIHVSDVSNTFNSLNTTNFKCYEHKLPDLNLSLGIKEISGIRLYIPKSLTNQNDLVEIQLYKKTTGSDEDRHFLCYTPGSKSLNRDKVYIFYHSQDPRPLLFRYDNKGYERIRNDNTKWYQNGTINFTSDQLKTKLNEIYNGMKKKLQFVENNDNDDNVNSNKNQPFGSFQKDSYTPKTDIRTQENLKLSKNLLLDQQNIANSNLGKLLHELYGRLFDEINLYKKDKASSLKDFLLFEFINESQKTYFKRKDEKGDYWVEEFIVKNDAKDLPEELQKIESNVKEVVIYEIDNTKHQYNSYIDILNEFGKPTNGFSICTHTPNKDGHQKSLFFYRKKQLMKKVAGVYRELFEINVNKYNKVVIYFGSRAKDESSNLPLIIELIKSSSKSGSSTFYQHKRDGSNHYWDPVNIDNSTNDNQLIQKLNEAEFELIDSVVLLLEKNSTNNSYNESDVSDVMNNLQYRKEFKRINMGVKKISVSETTNTKGQCLKPFNYKMMCHDISKLTPGITGPNKSNVGISFVMPTINNKYNRITLYKSDKVAPENIEYTYYTSNQNEIYVYFYSDDPRPLLLCYGGVAYKPKNKDGYTSTWVKDSAIKNCLCQKGSANPQLLNSLLDVVGFMNEVRLEERPKQTTILKPNTPGNPDETTTYDIDRFKGQKIKIVVSYENKSCYRVYSHKPNGTGSNGSGFRLGNINYKNKVANGIRYTTSNKLESTSIYYSIYDTSHEHPLLVELKFEDNLLEYFELDDKRDKKWKKINYKIDSHYVEKTAYNARYNLSISYSEDQKRSKLFDDKECKEDQVDVPTVAGSTAGGLAGAGALGGGGYLLYAKLLVTATTVGPS